MLGDNIRNYRKLNNMSQDELAEKLNVTRQSISLWETEQTQPSLENIVALSKLFKVSTDELLVSDKIAFPSSNTVTDQKSDNPKNKTKIIFLVSGIVIAVVSVILAFVLLGTNNNSKNNEGANDSHSQITTENNIQAITTAATTVTVTESVTESVTTTAPAATTAVNNTSEAVPLDNEKDIFGYLKKFVIENGTINGDYCYYAKSADNYGGFASESFSLYYWGDTNKIEFCLHSVINETFSINFYLYVPEKHSGKYEYISSYYYRDTGEPLYEAKGTITAEEFTDNYPLNCTKYFGSKEYQNTFMEMSRLGICDLISCIEKFIELEDIKYSFEDFGFMSFNHDKD